VSGWLARFRAIRADPLYRYEVRRCWTPRRYIGLGLALAVCWAAVGLCIYLATDGFDTVFIDELVWLAVWPLLLGRIPLSFLAATGGALSIAPERSAGQFEQVVLSPVDPWRFCQARLFGRLHGLLLVWLALILPVVLLWPWLMARLLLVNNGSDLMVVTWVFPAMAVFVHLDLLAMLMVDAATGLRYSAECRSTAGAVFKTYAASFVVIPLAVTLGALAIGGGLGVVVVDKLMYYMLNGQYWCLALPCAIFVRAVLDAWALRSAFRDLRRAAVKVFADPE
jgi:hypothetical protein